MGLMAQDFNLSTRETEAGGSLSSRTGLYRETLYWKKEGKGREGKEEKKRKKERKKERKVTLGGRAVVQVWRSKDNLGESLLGMVARATPRSSLLGLESKPQAQFFDSTDLSWSRKVAATKRKQVGPTEVESHSMGRQSSFSCRL